MSYVRVYVLALVVFGAGGKKTFPRDIEGDNDSSDRYPYVGTFIIRYLPSLSVKNVRGCTGSIISSEWVLTAGHCLPTSMSEVLHFAYGDLSRPLRNSGKHTKVLRGVTSYYDQLGEGIKNDVGLAMVEPVKLNTYAKVSSVDYNSLIGYAVEYAEAGSTYSQAVLEDQKLFRKVLSKDQTRPLQIGKGVVAKCDTRNFYPALCIRPKCHTIKQRIQLADSGCPLFYNGKIIAVGSYGEDLATERVQTQFTPVSPFLDWIKDTVNKTANGDYH